MTPEKEAFLRKYRADCQARDDTAREYTKQLGKLNAKLIFASGAGQLLRRGLQKIDETLATEVKEAIDGA